MNQTLLSLADCVIILFFEAWQKKTFVLIVVYFFGITKKY